jgi:hypothetical protein
MVLKKYCELSTLIAHYEIDENVRNAWLANYPDLEHSERFAERMAS